MNKFVSFVALVLSVAFSGVVTAGECGKEVAGGCATAANSGSATHLHADAVKSQKLDAKRAADDEEAHKAAQKLIDQAKADSAKAEANAEANKSLVQKVKEKLSLH